MGVKMISHVLIANPLLTAFAVVGLIMWVSALLSKYLTFGRIHGSAIAIMIGLALAFAGGIATGGDKGLADIPVLAGAALGASSAVIAISIATGVTKAVLVMIGTPLVAKLIGLNNPRSAMVFGGLMGTVSGVSGGLAATDRRLVPYGALTATFHTGVGCLIAPSVLYLAVRAIVGA
jgi:Malonate/sodium symporter MadM subunit